MLKGAGELDLVRFLAIISYQMGLSHRTTMKYLRDLEELDFIVVDEIAGIIREVKKVD
ncbi:unnamed protein product [marine sediment metagenome]|uniref:Uncharacterized protein n=1 Tax=marine sediment metagenome TaxID=412755 RepID=X1PIJ6_9ZZZZ